jgi:hypothetical protein
MLLERLHLVFVCLRPFEFESFGGFFHKSPVMLDGFPAASLQHGDYFFDVVVVFLLGDRSYATALAPADMVLQTRTEFAVQYRGRVYLEIAGPQRIDIPEHLQKVARMDDGTVRAEISGTILDHAPGKEDLRELVTGDTYPRIGLRILQKDIVFWLVLLDQVVLKQQGVGFGIHYRVLGIGYLRDKDPCLSVEPGGVHKVLGDSFMQVFRLADINHISLGVIITIDSGGMRK